MISVYKLLADEVRVKKAQRKAFEPQRSVSAVFKTNSAPWRNGVYRWQQENQKIATVIVFRSKAFSIKFWIRLRVLQLSRNKVIVVGNGHDDTSSTSLITFHKALIFMGRIWIFLFSLQQWINSKTDVVLQPWLGNQCRRRKTQISNLVDNNAYDDFQPWLGNQSMRKETLMSNLLNLA